MLDCQGGNIGGEKIGCDQYQINTQILDGFLFLKLNKVSEIKLIYSCIAAVYEKLLIYSYVAAVSLI